jgi:hypothetical protein
MKNPSLVREGANSAGRTLAQSPALGNAKVGQNHEFAGWIGAVDKPATRPYLCRIESMAITLILLVFLAVEPITA